MVVGWKGVIVCGHVHEAIFSIVLADRVDDAYSQLCVQCKYIRHCHSHPLPLYTCSAVVVEVAARRLEYGSQNRVV